MGFPFKCRHCIAFVPVDDEPPQETHGDTKVPVLRRKEEKDPKALKAGKCLLNPPQIVVMQSKKNGLIRNVTISAYPDVHEERGCMQFIPSAEAPEEVQRMFMEHNGGGE
jgi:hypothetical protein